MESALPLLLFLGCLTGFTLLILVFGYRTIEEERAREEAEARASAELPQMTRSFFAAPARASGAPEAVPVDDSVVESVEKYLHDEQLLASRFVEEPSAERLHVHSQWSILPNDSMFEGVEQLLSRERELAEEFVSNPSVESLYGQAHPLVAMG